MNTIYNKSLYHSKGIDLFSLLMFILFVLATILNAILFKGKFHALMFLFLIVLYLGIVLLESYHARRSDYSFYLAIPVILSATQNIYLGVFSPYISNDQIQMIIITNFLYSIILFFVLFLSTPMRFKEPLYGNVMWLMVALVGYSLVTMVVFGANLTSGIASLRNIMNPFLYFIIGLLASIKFYRVRYLRYITYLTTFVVVFGLIERFIVTDVWSLLNIGDLWTKKGLPISEISGIPLNFYSSELINGEQARRMVSSFADPVNLGTFLFFGFMASWYLNKKITLFLVLSCILLAISKGALLGLLVFVAVWSYYKMKRTKFYMMLSGLLLLGLGFIFYSYGNSTMSMFLHVTGFFSSLKELLYHPLGRGLGNIGVLAGLYSQGAKTEITESGLGMVIGQLGIVGFVIYIYLFVRINKELSNVQEIREKILLKTLLFSIFLNIMFNEVALSPNSSAVYFMMLGVSVGYWNRVNKDTPNLSMKKKRYKKIVW